MARRTLPRTVLVALTLAVLASCSKGDDEPVATGAGGIELSATTTENPDVPEPETTTTTTRPKPTTTTTTTTSTTTTTTAPPPVVPTADELRSVLPGAEALAAGEWTRTDDLTAASSPPAPLCDGSDTVSPLAPIVYDAAGDGGAMARYQRPDESTRALLVVAPLADAEAQMAIAKATVDTCGASGSPLNVLAWPTIGDDSVAYSRTEEADGQGQTAAWAIARVGGVVVALNVQSFWADGQQLLPAPTEAELQSFLGTAVEAVRGLTPAG